MMVGPPRSIRQKNIIRQHLPPKGRTQAGAQKTRRFASRLPNSTKQPTHAHKHSRTCASCILRASESPRTHAPADTHRCTHSHGTTGSRSEQACESRCRPRSLPLCAQAACERNQRSRRRSDRPDAHTIAHAAPPHVSSVACRRCCLKSDWTRRPLHIETCWRSPIPPRLSPSAAENRVVIISCD